jgi:hypothetical protein
VRPGPDNWGHGLWTSPHVLAGPVPPRARKDEVLRNIYHRPGPPWDGLGPPCVEAGSPRGLCAWASQGGPELPSHQGGGPVPPRAPEEAAAKPAPPRVRWIPAFCEKSAQLPHKCRWLGCAHPRQGIGCPLTCWTGMRVTMVSPPVTEVTCYITVPRA